MQFVRGIAEAIERRMSIADFDHILDMQYGGTPTYSGKLISQQTALSVSTIWACVSVLADDIATLPLQTFRRIENGRDSARDHYLWSLLLEQANPEMTAFRFKQLMQLWVLLWGNAYAEMEISGRGQVTALWPMRPDRVKISRSEAGQLQYTYRMIDGHRITLPHERVLHLRGMGTDGVYGLSPIDTHKQTIGWQAAMTEHSARFFGSGARPLGILTHPGKLGEKARENLRQSWMMAHAGLTNAHRVAILEEGLGWTDAGTTMVDAQYIESQNFAANDIARIYKVPPHRVGILDRATNNNIEWQGREYVSYTLAPWTTNWSQEIHFSCLSPREQQSIFTDWDFTSLIMGDLSTQAKFYGAFLDRGVVNSDEVRERSSLNMNPQVRGTGKQYYRPINSAPVTEDGLETPDAPVPPPPPGKPVQPKQLPQ